MIIPDNASSISKLCKFIEFWVGPRSSEFGVSLSEIDKNLPEPLKQLYAFLGNWPHPQGEVGHHYELIGKGPQPRLLQHQDALLGMNSLVTTEQVILFATENQGNWGAYFNNEGDNPCVISDANYEYGDAQGPEVVCETLSHFLVTLCLQELLMSSPIWGVAKHTDVESASKISTSELWLNGRYVFNHPTHNFYLGGDEILFLQFYGELWFACRDKGSLKNINGYR